MPQTAQLSSYATPYRATELDDPRWRELLGQFERLVEHDLARHRGPLDSSAHDGVVATFDIHVTARVMAKARAEEVVSVVPTEPVCTHVADLSDRERDVLALVAEGRSNQEIAASLYLSVRTVERHLSNIYAKLRISGKAARAAAAARFSASRWAEVG
jgi:DNA-binding CsgD family transcriptional regulator